MINNKRVLAIIPARAGSKRLPNKNILNLAGKPLIAWTIEAALDCHFIDKTIVSTDSLKIKKISKKYGAEVPFIRPNKLATDYATTNDVIIHALEQCRKQNQNFDIVVLLQATSPLRSSQHIDEALHIFNEDLDMVVSVKKSHAASVLCTETEDGFLEFVLNKELKRSQDFSNYFEYNGAVYIISVNAIIEKGLAGFTKKIKYIMPEEYSVDIDTYYDFKRAEEILKLI
ncbi:MAG: acylneuraminate cytidylyltransferase family protein [Saprospiraceae bacterium]|nr:acylneuraminate cytidylyltransferase family protein [Saprospiraceae bacterium]